MSRFINFVLSLLIVLIVAFPMLIIAILIFLKDREKANTGQSINVDCGVFPQ